MPKKKSFKHTLNQLTYDKPAFNKTVINLRKSFLEAQSALEGKKKKKK